MAPGLEYERALAEAGYVAPAGIDEAGRGCWAGPVVAAAVMLGPEVLADPAYLAGVDDSKQLRVAQREHARDLVLAHAQGVGVGIVPAFLIDAYGIVPATRLAMLIALIQLPCWPDSLLIDAVRLPDISLPQQAIIRGDGASLSIAAASVVAKVTRDRLMGTADRAYPVYGFAAHKGYGTAAHAHALDVHGLCPLHRRSFRPLLERIANDVVS